jgi:hypothetical protein
MAGKAMANYVFIYMVRILFFLRYSFDITIREVYDRIGVIFEENLHAASKSSRLGMGFHAAGAFFMLCSLYVWQHGFCPSCIFSIGE